MFAWLYKVVYIVKFNNTNYGERRNKTAANIPGTEAGCGPTGQICTHTDRLSSPNPLRTYKSQIEKKTFELNATGEKLTILVVVVVVVMVVAMVVVLMVVVNGNGGVGGDGGCEKLTSSG